MSWLLVYAACIPMPTNEVTKATTHDTHSMARTPESLPDSDEHTRRKKMPPTSTSTDANASARVRPNAMPTPWSFLPATSPATSFALPVAAPTLNVNAPSIGCESTETTCQSTTYVPSSSAGSAVVTTESLSPCCALPTPRHGLAVAVQQLHRVLRELHALAERHRHGVGRLAGRQIGARLGAGALELGVRERGSGRDEYGDDDERGPAEEALHAASGRS